MTKMPLSRPLVACDGLVGGEEGSRYVLQDHVLWCLPHTIVSVILAPYSVVSVSQAINTVVGRHR